MLAKTVRIYLRGIETVVRLFDTRIRLRALPGNVSECYEHAAEWLTPLLQNMPRRMIVSWADQSVDVRILEAKQPYWLVRNQVSRGKPYISVSLYDESGDPKTEMKALNEKSNKRFPHVASELFFPESTRKTAKVVENILQESKTGAELDVRLEFDRSDYEAVDENQDNLKFSFPGNEAWTRFANFVKYGSLVLDLHR